MDDVTTVHDDEVERCRAEKARLRAENTQLLAERQTAQEEIARLQAENRSLREQTRTAEQKTQVFGLGLAGTSLVNANLLSENSVLRTASRHEEELVQLKKENAALKTDNAKLHAENATLHADIAQLRLDMTAMSESTITLGLKVDELGQELATIKSSISVRQEASNLEKKLMRYVFAPHNPFGEPYHLRSYKNLVSFVEAAGTERKIDSSICGPNAEQKFGELSAEDKQKILAKMSEIRTNDPYVIVYITCAKKDANTTCHKLKDMNSVLAFYDREQPEVSQAVRGLQTLCQNLGL